GRCSWPAATRPQCAMDRARAQVIFLLSSRRRNPGRLCINWPAGAPENPASPPIEYRLHLLWIVLILMVLPAAWLVAGGADEARAIPRRLVLAARIGGMALLIPLLAVGAQSYRRPVAVYAFRGERSYLLLVSRGRARLGRPPATDPRKLAVAASGLSRLRNTDLIWTL